MTAATPPADEARRLAALRAYGVLDTPPEPAFDDISMLAAHICGTPIALTSLVDEHRQWFKSHHGLDATQTSRDVAFCAHAILRPDEVLVVPDAQADPRFSDNPLVHDAPRVRFYAGAPLVTPDGDAIGTLCVIDRVPRDLTPAQREALRALGRQVMAQLELRKAVREIATLYRDAEHARNTHQAVFDATSEGMLLVGPDGRVVTANRQMLALLKATEAALVGRPLADLAPLLHGRFADAQAIVDRLGAAADDDAERSSAVVTAQPPDRGEFQMSVGPVRAARGQYVGRLLVLRDVTREREVDRMKTEFVSLVSHELRTPLTSIRGYTDLLLDGDAGPLAEEQRDYLDVVKQNGDRLVALVNDLLDISRMEAGRVQLNRRPFDLAPAIEGVVATLAPQVHAKGQELTVDVDPGLRPVLGDRERVVQVLTNLVSNANKYTPEGGKIGIRTAAQGGFVAIHVSDTGIGIAPEDQPKLFRKFYRVNNSLTRDVGGTGLGLAIVRSIVDLHGGSIDVRSRPGEGATFTVRLPLVPATAAARGAGAAPHERDGAPILVVEDDRIAAHLIRRHLERAGYAVTTAASAEEALELLPTARPELITLDIELPGIDGFAFAERVRRTPETAALPILVISVRDDARRPDLEPLDAIAKPIDEEELVRKVDALLGVATRRRGRAAPAARQAS